MHEVVGYSVSYICMEFLNWTWILLLEVTIIEVTIITLIGWITILKVDKILLTLEDLDLFSFEWKMLNTRSCLVFT